MVRPLLLNGFMATGKSTVGRLVAERLSAQFVDLDALIERVAGTSIASLFAERGEAGFRALEAEQLDDLLRADGGYPLVVSLGGGSLLDRSRRVELLFRCVVVTLTASPDEIVRRALRQEGSGAARPLLSGGDPDERVRFLLEQRAAAYAECHGRVATDGRTLEDIASDVVDIVRRDPVPVAAGLASYTVDIGSDLTERHLPRLLGRSSGTLLVTDENVGVLHGAAVRRAQREQSGPSAEIVLEPGEEHKNLAGLERIFEVAYEHNLDRNATFVGLGGGVVTDMTGFAAATWVRGVRWVGLPTTLLSMVDASVGGKTAVDFRTAKNAVGAFWQPSGVICDVRTLETETDRAFTGALSEVVKTALVGDPGLFTLLEERADAVARRDPEVITQLVERSVRVKARVVSLDERESGLRATLNLGHTIGHALESSGGYSALTHGEAVSLGLVAALRLGEQLGETPAALTARTLGLLERLGLPKRLGRDELRDATRLIGHDKKRSGNAVRFVFARELGDVTTRQLPLDDLMRWTPDLAG
ncbi:MAG TPA: 3-dehydroquinate synthase [Polyangiaceae bacterium]|nr:3-dehydroquinate synthase [Polyangiaceae bacterium]